MTEKQEFRKIFGFDAPVCQTSFISGKFKINIFALEEMIKGYDGKKCTFNGKKDYSLKMAIKEKYGEKAVDFVEQLI